MSHPHNLECPLCLELLVAACETSCGHAFCAPCIVGVWKSSNRSHKIVCPVDRREVSMLIPSWTIRGEVEAKRSPNTKGFSQYLTDREYDVQIDEYNTAYASMSRPAKYQFQEHMILLRRVWRESNTGYKVFLIGLALLGAIYFLYPTDLIPDAYGLIGFADDIFVIAAILWVVYLFVEWYRRKLVARIHTSSS
eukprot:TRINITY_DN1316_c0_g3_i1.p1 TRINITY_DN1316_c0_g3~~TRINITY_DN1316_c0_g3_i1.p1  ORF type:complete len:194 (-),score=16.01 TRINITY_DN1316_c0_g3_i1:19-600(-)